MRKLILRITLPALLALTFVPAAYAQDDERPEFKMSCPQVLKLGLNKFTNLYGEKTQDYSTVGQKMAFEYWVNCKRPANDALAAKLLSATYRIGMYEARRQQVDDAREWANKFGSALWNLRYYESGGGTMWGLISVGAYAERENFMETLIRALAMSDRKSARARQRSNLRLAKIERLLSDSRARQPFSENVEPGDLAESKKHYQESMQETQDALAKLRDILRDLPDAAAERLATKMASEAKNALEDSP
jgi:hypothetical protein